METMTDFIFFDSKLTVNSDCSLEIKILAPWKESYDKTTQHIKKHRHHFVDKGLYSKSSVFFPVFMYECENWTIKKVESQKIDAFELWCWRNLLRFPWTTRGSNQSILKEISPEYSLKRLMLKLKLQYFIHLIKRANSLEKTQLPGKIEDRRRKG